MANNWLLLPIIISLLLYTTSNKLPAVLFNLQRGSFTQGFIAQSKLFNLKQFQNNL